MYYKATDDPDFSDVLNKFEFASNASDKKKKHIHQEPTQMLVRNYISKNTIYENILLYHGLGVGKTCAAISIAEGFKEYVHNMGKKIFVLVKNKNIQKNFIDELLSKCTGDEYSNEDQKAQKMINKYYQFVTYGTFVNRVLGAKEFEKDELGRNTKKVKKVNGKIKRKQIKDEIKTVNNTVVIVDEAHNITNNDIYTSLFTVLSRSLNYRLVLLTATPMYDNPSEIFDLSNLLNVKHKNLQLKPWSGSKKIQPGMLEELEREMTGGAAKKKVDNDDDASELSDSDDESDAFSELSDDNESVAESDAESAFSELSDTISELETPVQTPIETPILETPSEADKNLLTKEQSKYINSSALKGGIVKITEYGLKKLEEALKGKVSYLKSNDETNPKTIIMGKELIPNRNGTTNVVNCEMSPYQYKIYLQALSLDLNMDSQYDLSLAIQEIESEENSLEQEVVSKASSLYKNSSDASTMTYPGNLYGKSGFLNIFKKSGVSWTASPAAKKVFTEDLQKYSNKLYKLLQAIQSRDDGNIFIYSNYVSYGGTTLIKQLLLHNGFSEFRGKASMTDAQHYKTFVVFDESTNLDKRERYKHIFNSDENKDGKFIRIIIGSPIVSEGVTFKAVRQVHILEPSWNMSRINQIIGRAVRNYSHHALDESERTVEIYKYVSVYPSKSKVEMANFFIDKEKYILAEEKDRSNKVVERLLKQISFDCDLNKSRNFIDSSKDGSAECDYTTCEYKCTVTKPDNTLDKSTYDMYITFFDQFDIYFVLETIKDLFKSYFIWSLDDITDYIQSIEPLITNEAVYTTLNYITQNKVHITDMYNRSGFIVNKGPYYIFNESEIDINTSLYSKMLDFSIDKNKYTLQEYVQKQLKIDVLKEDQKADKKKKGKQRARQQDIEDIEEDKQDTLTKKDLAYNENIENTYDIYGTFRMKKTKEDTWDHKYGKKDDKFRIIDTRTTTSKDVKDQRKVITGKWVKSYDKKDLFSIAETLGISVKSTYDKVQLGEVIQQYLTTHKRILL